MLPASLSQFFPFLRWIRLSNRETVRADIVAGLTGAAIVLPQGVAFAIIAGMPPEYGLYASMVPTIIAALFGSSWHLVSGPTTAASVVMYSALSNIAEPGSAEYISLAITLSFMVGMVQLMMGLAKLGALVNFISHSVVIGFTAGAALLIISKQLTHFFGLHLSETEHLVDYVWSLVTHLDQLHLPVFAVSMLTLLSAIYCRRLLPKLPFMIVAMVVGSVSALLISHLITPELANLETFAALPKQLPPLSLPDFSIDTFRSLAPVALAMTLFALTEAVSIARSIAAKSGQALHGNQEFIGQGLSNIAGSFFSSYVATGSFNRSGANFDSGARTPLAAVLAGLILLVSITFVAPLTAYLPKASVSALLILVAWRLIDFHHFKKLAKADGKEGMIILITFFSTLFLELEFAILLGVILSLMIYLRKTSKPKIIPRVPNPESPHRKFTSSVNLPECPQLKILRLEDSLYFGSVTHTNEILRLYREHYPEQKNLLLLTKGVNQVDAAGAELLVNEALDRRRMGGNMFLYRIKDSASKVLRKGDYLDYIGEENIFDSKSEAIVSIVKQLDRQICRGCEARIFNECPTFRKTKKKASKRRSKKTSAKAVTDVTNAADQATAQDQK